MIRPIPGLPIEDQNEPVVLTMLCWGEARGEPTRGKLAVLHVVRNRAMKRDTSMKVEALRKWQFSCFNDNDPNRKQFLSGPALGPSAWAECSAVVELVLGGDTTDPMLGATHYFVTSMTHPPPWGPGHPDWKELVVIHRHTFGTAA